MTHTQPTIHEGLTARVVARYTAHEGYDTIAAAEHIGTDRVGRILRSAGVAIRPRGKPRTYAHNEHYFSGALDEARAYWIGFLFADGCVTDRTRLQVTLAETDTDHIYKLRDALESTHPVSVRNRTCGYEPTGRMASLYIRSAVLVGDLARYGVVPRKSSGAVPPTLPEPVQRHFWRGVLDGNGYVCVSKGIAGTGLTGSRATCDAFAEWVRARFQTVAQVKPNHSIWTFAVGGRNTPGLLLSELYSGASVALARKANLAAGVIAARLEWLAEGGTPRTRRVRS